jgi:hypothetical protein
MKKLLIVLICLVTTFAYSQKKDKSGSFETPGVPCRILQMKSGFTVMMELVEKEGIKIILLDTMRKKVAAYTPETKMAGRRNLINVVEGMFEVKGDIVIFIQGGEDRTPWLIRLILDGKTGQIKSEEKIAELDRLKAGVGYAIVFGGVELPDFIVVQDPESDYYAVIRYNVLAAETIDRIEVIHYSPDHKVINSGKYRCPSDRFKYTRFLSAYVNKDNYVDIATYGYNTDKSGGDEGRFYIAQLAKGKSDYKQVELPYTDYWKGVSCSFAYNKVKKMVHMSLITDVHIKGDKRKYDCYFQYFNPSTLKVEKGYSPDFTAVDAYYKEKMERDDDYSGMLQETEFDKNGNMIMLYQGVTRKESKYGVDYFMGDAALLTITPEGKTINSAVFACSYWATGDPALSMDLVTTDIGAYVVFNNTVDNMAMPENKEAKMLRALGPAVPVKYTYSGNSITKAYLFKVPKEKKGNPYCDFSSGNYNPKTNKFAVLYLDPEKDKAMITYLNLDDAKQ